jgi:hypothetical protein
VVLIPLNDVNRTKVDGAAINGVVVKIDNGMCTVAVQEGVLKRHLSFTGSVLSLKTPITTH